MDVGETGSLRARAAAQIGAPGAWEVRDNRPAAERLRPEVSHFYVPEFYVERTTADGMERAATCWDYGLACVIEAALNMRDGTVE